jgi:hypothetical protein
MKHFAWNIVSASINHLYSPNPMLSDTCQSHALYSLSTLLSTGSWSWSHSAQEKPSEWVIKFKCLSLYHPKVMISADQYHIVRNPALNPDLISVNLFAPPCRLSVQLLQHHHFWCSVLLTFNDTNLDPPLFPLPTSLPLFSLSLLQYHQMKHG